MTGAARPLPAHISEVALYRALDPLKDFCRGATIVVVGRSANVGKAAILLGLARRATVISCDEHTHRAGRLHDHAAAADVLEGRQAS